MGFGFRGLGRTTSNPPSMGAMEGAPSGGRLKPRTIRISPRCANARHVFLRGGSRTPCTNTPILLEGGRGGGIPGLLNRLHFLSRCRSQRACRPTTPQLSQNKKKNYCFVHWGMASMRQYSRTFGPSSGRGYLSSLRSGGEIPSSELP